MPNEQTSVPLFTSGEVLTAANMNLSAGTGVPVFTNTTTRDAGFGGAGEKVLAEGQLCYLSDSNIVQYYSGASWATVGPTAAGGMTLLSTTTLTGASVTVSGIDQTYNALQIYILGAYASSTGYLRCYFNADSTSGNYSSTWTRYRSGATTTSDDTFTFSGWPVYNGANKTNVSISLPSYAGAQAKSWFSFGSGITDNNVFGGWYGNGGWLTTTAISSLVFINSGASWTAGTVLIYGVK